MCEKVLVLHVSSKSLSIFIKHALVFEEKCGDIFEKKVMVFLVSGKSLSIFIEKALVFKAKW